MKNREFAGFLNDRSIFENGEIRATREILLERLKKIFTGTKEAEKFYTSIENSKDGKEIFEIIAKGFSEEQSRQESGLEDMGFKMNAWKEFQKKPENKKIITKIQDPNTSPEEIKALLKDFIDPEKIPANSEEKQAFLEKIIQGLNSHEQMVRNANAFVVNKENIADFSTSWKTGDFTEFNAKTQEREQKRGQEESVRQQEQKQ